MSDEDFLSECEAKANDATEVALFATNDWHFDDKSHELQTILSTGQPIKIGHIIDHHDGVFIAHARTSNPDLAARVLRLVEMVKERDAQIEELTKTPAIQRCDNCRLYMSEDQERCPNCGARQDDE